MFGPHRGHATALSRLMRSWSSRGGGWVVGEQCPSKRADVETVCFAADRPDRAPQAVGPHPRTVAYPNGDEIAVLATPEDGIVPDVGTGGRPPAGNALRPAQALERGIDAAQRHFWLTRLPALFDH